MTASVDTYRLDLPYEKPPLTANSRMHWGPKSKLTRMMRSDAHTLAKAAKLPPCIFLRITVQLHYRPKTNRRRDPSNLMPTQKAILDGLVDYGLVPDDCPPYVTELVPAIHPAEKGLEGSLWLTITIGEPQ
ncbi:hypothetical protein EV641_109222 [Rhodococcus sp. SMB37]|uniref:hypothetical protein n=1 Tax=Rhodococcus sp. SMB37 TaxID=2512213 RepID=UPI00104A9308|nr:hypothetical protein [Rhodococcus sp. SMB37]TCN51831.1 hypothetical protein EV641_109222 [Rhodococcus sp. SMB37]